MHIIDRKWIDLATGYRTVLSLQAQLETEFGRAVQVGLQQKYNKELAEWQKKRRVFFILAAAVPLSLILLCLAAFYFREMACVIIYWTILVLILIVTLAVAGRTYLKDVINRPQFRSRRKFSSDLQDRWWAALTPMELALPSRKGNETGSLLSYFTSLPDTSIGIAGDPADAGTSVYIFTPSGPWIFICRDWSGSIVKQEGAWKQLQGRGGAKAFADAPDEQWFRLKERLAQILSEHFSHTSGRIQGGVAFTNPKAQIMKDLIQGNAAAVGSVYAWIDRIGNAPATEGLDLDMQLKALDALIAVERAAGDPSCRLRRRDLAVRLHQDRPRSCAPL